jgi:hypothetical protein
MLIATFGPNTERAGTTITYENGAFVLGDDGPVSALEVMQYDQQGQLVWESDGTRVWVGSRAQAPSTAPSGSSSLRTSPRGSSSTGKEDNRTSNQKTASVIGLFLVVIGLFAVVYYAAFFDTSVAVEPVDLGNGTSIGGGRVNNIGLMADRQNGIIVGFGMAAVGGILMYIGRMRPPVPVIVPMQSAAQATTCENCSGTVEVGAAYCPHCGKRLSWTAVAARDDT